MNRRMRMKDIRRVIRLNQQSGLSTRQIAKSLNISRSTISDYLQRYKQSGLKLASLDGLTDSQIYASLFPVKPDAVEKHQKPFPNFGNIHTELKRRYMTRQLLWEEYRQAYPDGYGYTQFCQLYKNWSKSLTVSMRQIHKAGEKMFVDYSGLKWKVTDPKTGIVEEVDIFVAVLGASGYTYAEASRDQTKQSFINSHNHAFQYFGGVTEMIIPDNLKSAVTKASRYDPDLNETFQDMAEHYGTVILPARPYRPKDKGKVELSVKLVQRWILARLRHQTFFSIEELNEAIWSLLDDLNNRNMKKLEKSRRQLFEELDSPALKPLPVYPYELREFELCKVSIDYHIELLKCYYSVPYQLVGKDLDVRFTATVVEVFYQHKRVAFHKRFYRIGAYSTQKEHMASSHRVYAEWTPSRLINWALSFGKNMGELVETIMEVKPHPEMGFRTSLGIINTAKKYDKEAVELAARKMIELKSYRVRHFRSILKNKTYLTARKQSDLTLPQKHENLRGALYYK